MEYPIIDDFTSRELQDYILDESTEPVNEMQTAVESCGGPTHEACNECAMTNECGPYKEMLGLPGIPLGNVVSPSEPEPVGPMGAEKSYNDTDDEKSESSTFGKRVAAIEKIVSAKDLSDEDKFYLIQRRMGM